MRTREVRFTLSAGKEVPAAFDGKIVVALAPAKLDDYVEEFGSREAFESNFCRPMWDLYHLQKPAKTASAVEGATDATILVAVNEHKPGSGRGGKPKDPAKAAVSAEKKAVKAAFNAAIDSGDIAAAKMARDRLVELDKRAKVKSPASPATPEAPKAEPVAARRPQGQKSTK